MRSVHDDDVHTRLAQRRDAIERVGARADGRADAQPATLVLGGARPLGGLLDILDGDHALELVMFIDHQHLLDAVLVKQAEHLFARRVLAHRDEPVLRSHDGRHRLIQLGLEAQVARGDDPDEILAHDDGHPGDTARLRQLDDLTYRGVG